MSGAREVEPSGVHPDRVRKLNRAPARPGRYVLYWMQQSQRARCNPALELAVERANALELPVLAAFGLTADYPEANARHYSFMLEGLAETQSALRERGIPLVVRRGRPPEVALDLARDAALLVCDRAYTREPVLWRKQVAAEASCEVVQVEGDAVVPVDVASQRPEWAARTLRPKIQSFLDEFAVAPPTVAAGHRLDRCPEGIELDDVARVVEELGVDATVPPVTWLFRGGPEEAQRRLLRFLDERLTGYVEERNHPEHDGTTELSPYLHFGQISPLEIVLAVRARTRTPAAAREALIEQLVIRRELSLNLVRHQPRYDRYDSLPDWARRTLAEHREDERDATYTRAQLDAASTHDPYWNAAMTEMKVTGYMHNVMRMYWGKKILEWVPDPSRAFRIALELNNRYLLDGRDPNSYAGVGWVFGLHDRPWPERKVYGTVRCMMQSGLKRKLDPDAYVEKVKRLAERA